MALAVVRVREQALAAAQAVAPAAVQEQLVQQRALVRVQGLERRLRQQLQELRKPIQELRPQAVQEQLQAAGLVGATLPVEILALVLASLQQLALVVGSVPVAVLAEVPVQVQAQVEPLFLVPERELERVALQERALLQQASKLRAPKLQGLAPRGQVQQVALRRVLQRLLVQA